MYAYHSPAYWIDVGTPETYLQLNKDLLSGKSDQYPLNTPLVIGRQSEINATAQIKGRVVIGANCSIGPRVKLIGLVVIGDGCTILEESVIEESIIWRNARLGPKANLKNSILADNCCCHSDSLCQESVLGDNVTLIGNCELDSGSKIWPDTTVTKI
jgi:mannose-1-phosphate guanylyltransferase